MPFLMILISSTVLLEFGLVLGIQRCKEQQKEKARRHGYYGPRPDLFLAPSTLPPAARSLSPPSSRSPPRRGGYRRPRRRNNNPSDVELLTPTIDQRRQQHDHYQQQQKQQHEQEQQQQQQQHRQRCANHKWLSYQPTLPTILEAN